MRKLLYTFLALVLVLSVLAVPASASGSADIMVEPSSVSVNAGESVSFTFRVTNGTGKTVTAVGGTLSATDGLVIDSVKSLCDAYFTTDYSNNNFTAATMTSSQAGTAEAKWDVFQVNCHINADAAIGSKPTLTFTVNGFGHDKETFLDNGTTRTATVTVTHATHTYDAKFDWTGYESATVTLTCKSGDSTVTGQNATVTHDVKKEPTCTDAGTTEHTASLTYGGQTYSDTKTETVAAKGHDWGEPKFTWGEGYKTATATRVCNNADHPETKTADVSYETEDATCTKAGKVTYTAKATFDGKEYSETKTEENAALGHKWGQPVVEWAADGSSVTVSRTCENDPHHIDTVESPEIKEVIDEDPTCTEPGSHHYEATGTYSTSKETFKDETEPAAVPATGHDFGDNEPNVDWPVEFPNVWKDKTGPLPVIDGMTVTLHCDNENKDIKGEVIEINETEIEEVKPTYTDDGSATFTAKVEFPDGKNGTLQLTSTPKTYTLPKLPLPEPSAKAPDDKVGADAEKNLAASAGSIVEDVLKGSTPAGVPDDIVQAITDAASSNQAGSMSVSTALTIADSTYTGTGVTAAYNVTVTMTVTGETGTTSAQLSHVAQPIEIKLPKGNAGPIVKVVHIVNGNQEPVDSKVVGDNVVFTAQDFSTYAIISSNDLEDAEISGVEPSYTYTGKAIEPAVKVTINGGNETLKEGTDYTVEYSGNDKPGTATVTIKGIGNYTGSVTKTFTILESAATAAPSAAPAATKAPSAPGTGDETPVALFAVVLTACAAVLGVVLFLVRRRQQQK